MNSRALKCAITSFAIAQLGKMEVEGSIRVVEEPDEGTLDEPVVVTIVRSICIGSLSLCLI